MVRRLLASLFLAAFPVLVIPIAVTSMGARAGAAPPAAVQQCKDGGWQTLTDASGRPFKNQGQCISYFIHNPVTLADLASSSVSGTVISQEGPTGCSAFPVTFNATYPGSSAVGTVTLQMVGCIANGGPNFPIVLFFGGTFTIATGVGTLTGTVAGQITNVIVPVPPPPDFNIVAVTATFTLTATSGTGLFTGTTGSLNLDLQFQEPPAFVGTITPT